MQSQSGGLSEAGQYADCVVPGVDCRLHVQRPGLRLSPGRYGSGSGAFRSGGDGPARDVSCNTVGHPYSVA